MHFLFLAIKYETHWPKLLIHVYGDRIRSWLLSFCQPDFDRIPIHSTTFDLVYRILKLVIQISKD